MTLQKTGALGAEQLNLASIQCGGLTWINIEKPSQAEMAYLAQHFPFHPLDLEDCVSRIQRPKVDEYAEYLFLVLHFPVFNRAARVTNPSQVAIFIGGDYVITIHAGNLRPLVQLFQECQQEERTRQETMGRSSGYLLYHILVGLSRYCFPILDRISANIDEVEDGVFSDNPEEITREISVLRRDIIAFRRIIRPQTEAIEALENKEHAFLKEDQEVYFGDIADQFDQIWDALEDYKEVVEGLNDTHFTLTSNRINVVLRALTLISTIMLPLTVVASIYGMNVPLPFQHSARATVFALLTMLGIAAGMLLFFRSRHWV